MTDRIEELKKRGMITSLARVPDAQTDSPARAAEGEEIMVNTAHDVYMLPLHPTGLTSGPRFVVHVPGPEERPQKAVAWARPVYAKPVGAPEAVEGEMVDVEFHLRAERPEGEGWRPLVFAASFPARPNANSRFHLD